ncbi:unnamed protein product [Dicrocoelium dendriticum]|nr:unnamed protein product [Dicrocoelium dendriticum]
MAFLHSFPTRSEAPLDVWEVDSSEIQFSEWKYCKSPLPTPVWVRRYCVCLENEQTFLLFRSYQDSLKRPSAAHIPVAILGRFADEHLAVEKNGSRYRWPSDNEPKPLDTNSNALIHSRMPPTRRRTTHPTNLIDVHPRSALLSGDTSARKHSDPCIFGTAIHSTASHKFNSAHHTRTASKSSIDQQDPLTVTSSITSVANDLDSASASLVDSACRINHCSSFAPDLNGAKSFPSEADLLWAKVHSFSQLQKLFRSIRRSFSSHHFRRHECDPPSESCNWAGSSQLLMFAPTDSTRTSKSSKRRSRLFHCADKAETSSSPEGFFHHVTIPDRLLFRNWESEAKSKPLSDDTSCVVTDVVPCTLSASNGNCTFLSTLRPKTPCTCAASENSTMDSKATALLQARQYNSHCDTFVPSTNAVSTGGFMLGIPGLVHFGPVHPSLTVGRAFCFVCLAPALQLSDRDRKRTTMVVADANLVTRIFATPSQLSRLRWLRSLRRTAKPNLENERHRENSLRLSILEARNCPPKRRYYCDICLDRTLYARTTSKTASPSIFWAEDFDLNNLPNVSVMTLSLYKEADSSNKDGRRFGTSRSGSKKHRKSQNQLIGFVTIPTFELSGRTDTQMWVTLQPPAATGSNELMSTIFTPSLNAAHNSQSMTSVDGAGHWGASSGLFPFLTSTSSSMQLDQSHVEQRHLPQLRIRARYQSIEVLPVRSYASLKKIVFDHSLELSSWLEHVLSVKCKESVAGSLVALHESNGTLVDFLTNLVVHDVSGLENESMAFRSNSMATKAVECYVKLVGSTYLHNLLHRLIQCVLTCSTAWEVNPEKLPTAALASGSLSVNDTAVFASTFQLPHSDIRPPPGSLMTNQVMLLHHLNAVWRAIQASLPRFPSALIRVFSSFRTALEPIRGPEFCDNLVSACIFLRLICPALLSPSLFGLVTAFPSEPACRRNLTLLAKSLQSLANFSAFDDKEPFMRFLNGFVSSQLPAMRRFIRGISRWPSSDAHLDDFDTMHGLRDLVDEGYELAHLHALLSDLSFGGSGGGDHCAGSESMSKVSNGGTSLPPSLSELPHVLDELSSLLRSNVASCAQSLLNIAGHHLQADEPNDRLHSTLPSNMPRRLSEQVQMTQTDCRLSTRNHDGLSPDYAYHLPKTYSPVPYYTLHNNPGYHDAKVQKSTSVNILSASTELTSAGQTGVSIYNPNDYDEPYASPHSEPEDDNSYRRTKSPPPQLNSPPPSTLCIDGPISTNLQEQTIVKQSNNTTRRTSIPTVPPSPSNSTPALTCTVNEDDHVYDFVPLSGASSTDDLVQVNEKYLKDFRNGSPHLKCRDSPAVACQPVVSEPASLLTSEQLELTRNLPATAVSTTSCLTSHRAVNALHTLDSSPRLQSRQVTTASILLTRHTNVQPPAVIQSAVLSSHPLSASPLQGSLNSRASSRSDELCVSTSYNNCQPFPVPFRSHSPSSLETGAEASILIDPSPGVDAVSDNTKSSQPAPKELVEELVRLRHQLQVSREDAAWAANRLSQQEAELSHLRQLVGCLRGQPQVNCKLVDSVRSLPLGISRSPANGHLLRATTSSTNTAPSISLRRAPNTFVELDDAMARLEQEQAELQQEQVRIRARLAASRYARPAANSPIRSPPTAPQLPVIIKPTNHVTKNGLRSSKLAASSSSSGEDGVSLLTPVPQYGPRVRHNPPPPPPRNVPSRGGGRFAY